MAAITLPFDVAMYTGGSFSAIVGATAITNPYAVVIFGANQGEVLMATGANLFAAGVINEPGVSASNPLAVGERVTVYFTGMVWVMASAALATIGATVGTAATGKVAAATAANAYVGRIYGTAGADTELVPMLITLGSSV